ncbi:hypothetical protein L195_g063639, partial [Trifolium pratense]
QKRKKLVLPLPVAHEAQVAASAAGVGAWCTHSGAWGADLGIYAAVFILQE